MASQRPTIDDVARLAGVGRTTVSRVVNNGPFVRQELRDRVMEAVERLGFRVNLQARNLAAGTSREIALILSSDLDSEPNSYYSSGLELGAMRGCTEHGFSLSNHNVNQNGPDPEERIAALVKEGRYQAIILTPPFSDSPALIERLASRGCAVACISAGPSARLLASSVGIDDEAAGYDLTRYLVGLGHRDFGFILGIEGHVSAEGRYRGFRRALAEAGVDPGGAAVERGNFTFHSGIACAQSILARSPRPTALICANDDTAAGAMLTAHKMGLDIPGDVSIAGFDDTPVSEIVWPPLTTVHQPIREMGRRAVELALESVGEGGGEPKAEIVPHHIAIRESAASPKA